jgi:subfamily B ATP-binding cassette protein MsbA
MPAVKKSFLPKGVQHDLEIMQTLWPYLNTHRYTVPIIVCLGLLSSVLEGAGLYLFLPLLSLLGQGGALPTNLPSVGSSILDHLPTSWHVPILVVLVIGAVMAKNVVSYINGTYFARIDAENGRRLRQQLFSATLSAHPTYIDRQPPGRLANALLSETWRVARALGAFYRMIVDACSIAILVIVLLVLSWKTAALVMPMIAVIGAVMHLVTERAKAIGDGAVAANTSYTDRTWETLGGLRTIRVFGRERFEEERHEEASLKVKHFFLSAQLLGNLVPLIFETLVAAALGFWIIIFAWSETGVPTIAVFLLVLYRMQPRVRSLISSRAELLELGSAVLEVESVKRECELSMPKPGTRIFQALENEVAFSDVSATYSENSMPAITGITFSIPRNTTTALVGPSGAGKTTIANILLRNLQASGGEVTIDGVPLDDIRAADWHQRIAAVSQEIFLFDGSIRDNIRYGLLEATDEEIAAAAKLAYADEFIDKFPDGYEANVGERGSRLSGGQRQRIALARALIRKPAILVIDEATNALDSHSEQLIQRALDSIRMTTTVLTVAHRLSTVRNADQILVIDGGEIIERGTYSELVGMNGKFNTMVRSQVLEFSTAVGGP